jgi:hypothetical protein
MQFFLPCSSRINSGLLAVDVSMSIPGQPSIAHVGTCALLSGAHFQNVTQQREKKLWKRKALPCDKPKSALACLKEAL